MSHIGRNDPCSCGSGKKYKKCCLLKSYPEAGREASINNSLITDILSFIKKNYEKEIDEAYDFFWDDFDPEEHLEPSYLEMTDMNFWEWLIHDWQVDVDKEDEKTFIELYLEKKRGLTEEEKIILHRMNDAVVSLYEVQEVIPDEGLILKDLLQEGDFRIKEKKATRSLKQWDILASRLLLLDGHYRMTGCAYPYRRHRKEMIIEHIKAEFKDYLGDCPDASMWDFLKENSDLFNFYWCEDIRTPFRPSLRTTDGEAFLFSKALFEIKDKAAAVQNLKQIKGFKELDEGIFQWLAKRKEDGSATMLGDIKIMGGTLTLECSSKERLEKGKSLLLKNLSGLIAHKADTFQDPYQAMKNMEKKQPDAKNTIPKDVQQELYSRYTQSHYEKWLNEELPALNGKTPLEMVKTSRGKEKVREILKQIENAEEHRRACGEPYFDTSWLWERLNLKK